MPSVTKPCLATGSRHSLSTVQTTLLAQYVVEVDIQPILIGAPSLCFSELVYQSLYQLVGKSITFRVL